MRAQHKVTEAIKRVMDDMLKDVARLSRGWRSTHPQQATALQARNCLTASGADSAVGRRTGSQMQEVQGSNPRLGGLGVSAFQASGGIRTLHSRASGLQSTAQGNSIRTKNNSESK